MTSGTPAVSVLVPVRDGGLHLDEAMASILAQTFDDFEVIAIDDGSTDDTADRLERWAMRDARFTVGRQKAHGIVGALERARKLARGRYLARMDADDIAEPHRLAAQHAYMEARPHLAGCGCGVRYFPADAVGGGARRYERWINGLLSPDDIAEAIFVECPLAHPTFFLRADAVSHVGGYLEREWPEDYDLVLRLWADGRRLANVPDVLHRWRERADRLSRTSRRYSADAFRACKVHYLRRTLLRDGRGVVIWGAGPIGKSFARALMDAGTDIEAFVELDPRKIGQSIHGAPVLDATAGARRFGPLHLPAVGQPDAREAIAGVLRAAGHAPLEGFVPVA